MAAEGRADQLGAEREQLLRSVRLLEEHCERHAEVYARSPVPILLLDGQGGIEQANQAAAERLGVSAAELIGTGIFEFVAQSERRRFGSRLIDCPDAPAHAIWQGDLRRRDGWTIPIRIPICRRRGGYIATLLDLSELRAAQVEHERLIAAEHESSAANEAKNHFIAVLSHELRTPLTPVLAAVSAYAEREDLPEDVRSAFAMVQRNVTIEAHLIDDLLDVTRIAHGKLRIDLVPRDVHAVLREAVQTLSTEFRAKSLDLLLELNAERSWARADSIRLRQVFWNLLKNALKFTPTSGQITVRSWNAGRALLVEVGDSGCGLDRASLERLFEPFEQGHSSQDGAIRGLGLGLAICRGILELHGATISAASPGPGKGSRFTVQLNTVDPEPEAEQKIPSSAPPALGQVRILLVEDHEDTASILQMLLIRNGYRVQVVHSVAAALATPRSSYDLVISDIGLGDGTGHDLMRTLTRSGKLKGIALSGFGTEADVQASRAAGFAEHVTKPVNIGDLLQAIARLYRPER